MYYSLVQSHIVYGIALWGSGSAKNLDKILKLQKRAVRYMCGLNRFSHCSTYFKELGILTVPSLYVLEVCLYARKRMNQMKRVGDNHEHDTRMKNDVAIPIHRTSRFESKPSFQGTRFYKRLPKNIREIESYKEFKKTLKAFLLDRCLYNLLDL